MRKMDIFCILLVVAAAWFGSTKPKKDPCLMARWFAKLFPGTVARLQAWARKEE